MRHVPTVLSVAQIPRCPVVLNVLPDGLEGGGVDVKRLRNFMGYTVATEGARIAQEIQMQGADVVRARIDPDLKRQATEVLDEMGLSLSDAIRLLFVRIAADRAMPFEVRAPNKQTIAALEESERGGLPAFQSIEALMADLNDGKD